MKIYEPDYFTPPPNVVAALGRALLLLMRDTGRALAIFAEGVRWLPAFWQRRKEVIRQLYICGIKSFPVTSMVALFTGMILALQTGLVLRDYGQQTQVGLLVAQAMCREMGPFMTALILAASVGSAMAAELGTMAVSEEIAALHVMSINPVRFLVMPRLLALLVMCPVLTVYTNVVGVLGGMLVAYTQLGVAPVAYYDAAMNHLHNKELYVGLLKAVVFGGIIAGIACFQGLATANGAMGVGRATRRAVVHSFLLVLISGYIITRFFY